VATKAARLVAKARALLRPAAPEEPEPPRNMVSRLGHEFEYYFDPIPWFDARKGHKRFPGGVGAGIGPPVGYGDIWRSRCGDVVARMRSQSERVAFQVLTVPSAPVLDDEIDVVHDDLMNLLELWIYQGVDDWPEI
jgi:hypothetical protein